MTLDQLRQAVLFGIGTGALVYGVWPPSHPEYFGIAGALMGVEPLVTGYQHVGREHADDEA